MSFRRRMQPVATLQRLGNWLCALLLVLVFTDETKALVVIQPIHLVASEFPQGGLIVGYFRCSNCGTDDLSFFDASGNLLSGTFIDTSELDRPQAFAWQPESLLEPGNYEVYVNVPTLGENTLSWSVVPENAEATSVDTVLRVRVNSFGDSVECLSSSYQGPNGFSEQEQRRAELVLSLKGLYASQYSYSLVVEGEEPEGYAVYLSERTVNGASDELCFEVLSRALLDGEEGSLGLICVGTEDLNLGIIDKLSGNFEYVLEGCTVPPLGYEDEWCAVFSEAFSSQSCVNFAKEACFSARRSCLNGDSPPEGAEESELIEEKREASDTGEFSTNQGPGNDPPGDSSSSEYARSDDTDANACNIAEVGWGRGHQAWWLLAMGLFILRRARSARSSNIPS